MTVVIHVDDVLTEGEWESLDVLDQQLTGEMDIKSLGRVGPDGLETIKYLKRTIKWTGKGFSWTGDSKHIAKAVEVLGLQDAKPADTPGAKATDKTMRDALEPLTGDAAKLFPSVAGLVNFVAVDRPDIQYSVKCVMNEVAAPSEQSMNRLCRVMRYLTRHPVLKWRFPRQPMVKYVDAYGDSDWAGEHGEVHKRRSTTCVV